MDGESYELGGSREKPHGSENGYPGLFSLLSLQSKYRDGVQNIPLQGIGTDSASTKQVQMYWDRVQNIPLQGISTDSVSTK